MDPLKQLSALLSIFEGNAAFSMLLLLLVVIYFGSDRSVLHFSRNGRRLYFLLLTSLVSWWLLSAVQQASSSGIEVLMIFVIITASVVEDKLEQSIYLTPFSSRQVDFVTGTPEAIGKAELLESIVRGLNRWQGFSIGLAKQIAWVDGSLHRQQAAIHQASVIETADRAELNYLIAHGNCANLLEVASEETINMLTSTYGCLKQLTVLSRAVLLDGLQKVGLRHRPLRQMWAQRILLATHGLELTELKSLLDDAPDYHTFYKLVYSDVQGVIQQQVLEHVSREGQCALNSFAERHTGLPGMILKVVSDIDDTLMSSGGHFPAGRDTRFPQKCVYPGVLSFYKGLDTGFALRVQASRVGDEPTSSEADPSASAHPLPPSDPGSPSVSGSPSPLERRSPARMPSFSSRSPTPSSSKVSQPVSIPHSAFERPSPSGKPPIPTRSAALSPRPRELPRRSSELGGGSPPQGPYCGHIPQQLGEQEPSGDLESVDDGSVLDFDVEIEHSSQSNDRGGLLGTTAGAAIGAVMPSANSVQSMVGFSMLVSLPAYAGTSTGPYIPRPSTGCKGEAASSSGRDGPQQTAGHLVFLSARPQSYKGLTEGLSFRRIFEPLVRRGELQGYPLLLLGSMRVGPAALYSFAADRGAGLGPASLRFYKALAAKKLARFKQFAAVYPECCWIFVGDNGQGDMLLAEELNRICGSKMVACFLHQVGPLEETASRLRSTKGQSQPEQWLETWRQQRIYVAPDFVSLAAEARKQSLLDDAGLHRVGQDACLDLRRAAARFPRSAFDWSAAVQLLNDGLRAANEALPEHMQLDLIQQKEPEH